jgi:ligand-binding sensor domain-containing protein
MALGTSFNGLVTLDKQRRIFHHVNKKNGLGNNTVLSLFATPAGSIWLGLDNGAAFADLNSAFSAIFPDGELQGTGYTAEIFNGNIFFGTNTGLFSTTWKPYYQPEEKLPSKE